MCEFVSWIEKGDKVYFLTAEQVFNSPRGQTLRDFCQNPDDYTGHGAIRFYYDLQKDEGREKELTDFSIPASFPPEIVKAIKNCEFQGMVKVYNLPISQLLSAPACEAYQKATATAEEAYQKATAPAYEAYQKAMAPAYEAYQKATAPACEAYQKAKDTAWEAYLKATAPAWEAYQKAKDTAFWDLFKDLNNRHEYWK